MQLGRSFVAELSPSPRPSPAGRGRIVRRLIRKPATGFAGRVHEKSEAADCCSLSQRERAGVRILPTESLRFEPLNQPVLSRTRNSGAKAARTPNASRHAAVFDGRDSVWSARVFSTALTPGFMGRESGPATLRALSTLEMTDVARRIIASCLHGYFMTCRFLSSTTTAPFFVLNSTSRSPQRTLHG